MSLFDTIADDTAQKGLDSAITDLGLSGGAAGAIDANGISSFLSKHGGTIAQGASTVVGAIAGKKAAKAREDAQEASNVLTEISNKAQRRAFKARKEKARRQAVAGILQAQAQAAQGSFGAGTQGSSAQQGTQGAVASQAVGDIAFSEVQAGQDLATSTLRQSAQDVLRVGENKAIAEEERGAFIQGGISLLNAFGTPSDT